MAIITVSRLMGTGGGEVGKMVADKLDYDLVDRDRLTSDAKAHRLFTADELAHIDELKPRFLESLFGGRGSEYYDVMSTLIYGYGAKGNVVIVGGGAQVFLKDIPGALHVRITCSYGHRVSTISDRYKVSQDKAQKMIQDSDRNRTHFFKVLFNADWNDLSYYDMVLSTEKLDLEMVSEIITHTSEIKELEKAWEISKSMLSKLSLSSRIRAAFKAEKYDNFKSIKVNMTQQGYVHLTGYVSSEEEKERAESVVRSVEGVTDVINELTLMQFTPPMTPY